MKKREGFNFYLSYFDVYKELESDADKVGFIDALLHRQFEGTEPTELIGMAKFAYISQKYSIDKQVKGWEDKTKSKLLPIARVVNTPSDGVNLPPTQQVQVKEKEKVQEKVKEKEQQQELIYPFLSDEFLNAWNGWKEYRSIELKKKWKSKKTEQTALNGLARKSNDNEEIAIQIILTSIENSWTGLFELKTQKPKKAKQEQERIDQVNNWNERLGL